MQDSARRSLARLLGSPPDATAYALARATSAEPGRVADGLVTEALSNDDVTSAAAAQAFVLERLTELRDLLDPSLRNEIATHATAAIRKRAPEPS